MKGRRRKFLIPALTVGGLIVLNLLIHRYEAPLLALEQYGYAGIFLICLFLNATVLLPSSSTAVVMSMAAVYSPLLTALAGALGASLGEFTGYFAGCCGRSFAESSPPVSRVLALYRKHPKLTILLFAALPLPMFDVLGLMAGSVGMKKSSFFLLCLAGKSLKMLVYAYFGACADSLLRTLAV